MIQDRAIEYRRRAEECRQTAETARDKDTRAHFRHAEAAWLYLAEQSDMAAAFCEALSPIDKKG